MEHFNTYFFNEEGEKIGSLIGLIPITVGMIIEIQRKQYTINYIKLILADNSKNDPELGFHAFCK
jgi:hypothetical protein